MSTCITVAAQERPLGRNLHRRAGGRHPAVPNTAGALSRPYACWTGKEHRPVRFVVRRPVPIRSERRRRGPGGARVGVPVRCCPIRCPTPLTGGRTLPPNRPLAGNSTSGPGRSRTSARRFEVCRSSAELRGRVTVSVATRSTGLLQAKVADGTRTRDHRDHNPGLYQLSYRHRGADIVATAGVRPGNQAQPLPGRRMNRTAVPIRGSPSRRSPAVARPTRGRTRNSVTSILWRDVNPSSAARVGACAREDSNPRPTA